MKVIGSIVMYSGMRDPERELTREESKEICRKLCEATETSEKEIFPHLGPRGYMVIWQFEDAPWVAVHVHDGIIELSCFATRTYLKDTVGLESYLSDILASTLRKHHEEAAKALENFYEEMFRISKQEKV